MSTNSTFNSTTVAPPVDLDPTINFCARWYHQSAIRNQTLYIDGGIETFIHDPVSSPSHPYNLTGDATVGQNNYLIAVDLSSAWDWKSNISQMVIIKKPDPFSGTPPPVKIRGALYQGSDEDTNIWLYGGSTQYLNTTFPGWIQQPGKPEPDSPQYALWSYNTANDTWMQYDVTNASPQPPSSGAYTSAPDQGLAFLLNGQMDNGTSLTTLNLDNQLAFLPGLIVIDTNNGTAKNISTDSVVGNEPRTRGSLTYLPSVGDSGALVAIGGSYKSEDEYDSLDTPNYVAMDEIDVFDISSYYRNESTWYTQKASGTIPPQRAEFCAVGISTPDNKTHNIYIYGGRGPQNVYYDDMYVLSLPSFTWTLVYGPSVSPRYGHTCHVSGNRTLLTVGGITPEGTSTGTDACDWEYRGIAVLDLTTMVWGSVYDPNVPAYASPDAVVATIGGSNGKALLTAPSAGFSNAGLQKMFSGKSSSSSSENIGAIVGGTIGGVAGLATIVFLIWWFFSRKGRKQKTEEPVTETMQNRNRFNDPIVNPTPGDDHSLAYQSSRDNASRS